MEKKKKIKWIALVINIILLILVFLSGRKPEILQPKTGPITDAVYSLGTIKSDMTYNLRTVISTRIVHLFVSEGDIVKKNSPLIQLESGLTMYAPFTGIVSNIYMRQGEITMATQPVLTLINFDYMYIQASLDQESILKVRKGQKVEISFESLREKKSKGLVTSVYPASSSFIAKISTKELPQGVLPEMTCDLAIEIGRKENALLIPVAALEKKQGLKIFRKGQMIDLKPTLGNSVGDWIEVLNNDVQLTDRLIAPKPKTPLKGLLLLALLISLIVIIVKIVKKPKPKEF